MDGNPAIEPAARCTDCAGWGWHQGIRENPVDGEARLTDGRSLAALKAYLIACLCCPSCRGTGRARG